MQRQRCEDRIGETGMRSDRWGYRDGETKMGNTAGEREMVRQGREDRDGQTEIGRP